jgi:hypothetical protein
MKIFYGEMFRCINCHFLDAWSALALPNLKRDRRNTLVECYARW